MQQSLADAAGRAGRSLASVQAVCVRGCVQLVMGVTSCGPAAAAVAGEGLLLELLPQDVVAGVVAQVQRVMGAEAQAVVVQVGGAAARSHTCCGWSCVLCAECVRATQTVPAESPWLVFISDYAGQ